MMNYYRTFYTRRRFLLRIFTFLPLSIFCVSAQSVFSEDLTLLAKYDVNGDNIISTTEVEDKRLQTFVKMDFDASGAVSFSEYEEIDKVKRLPILKARFNKLDTNRDGRLTGGEYSSYLGSFTRLDKNQDGQVSKREIKAAPSGDGVEKKEADLCLLWVCVRSSIR